MVLKEPIPFSITVPMHGALNAKDDPSEIGDTELQVAEATIFDDKVAEKAPGTTKINPTNQLESGAKLDGVWRSYSKDGTPRLIAVCKGKVFSSSDWTTALYEDLTAGKRCTFKDYGGKTIITNGYDDPIVYNPKTDLVEGAIAIQGPRQIKKVAYFETDETWTGGAADKEAHVLDEYSGDSLQGRKLTSTGNWVVASREGAWDFTKFDDNENIGTWDFMDVSIFHRIRNDVEAIAIRFETSSGNYYNYQFTKDELDPEEQRDYQWTHLHIRKNAFTKTNSPNWATITAIRVYLDGAAGKTTEITFDNIRFRRTPPIAGEFKKYIATFEEGDETWTGGAVDTNPKHVKEGAMGRRLDDILTSAYCDKSLDLTRWISGQDQSDSDEIQIWAHVNNSSKVTSVTLKLGDADLSDYFYYVFETFEKGLNHWNKLTVKKSDFSETESPDWAAIERIQVEAVIAVDGDVTFDQWVVVEKSGETSITEVEKGTANETWNGGTWSRRFKKAGQWTRERIFDSSHVSGKMEVVFDEGHEKDLTAWDDASASTTEDFIAFFHKAWTAYAGAWVKTEIRIDCNNGNFEADYFKYTIDQDTKKKPGKYKGNYYHIRKRDFERVGTTEAKGWDTVRGFRFMVYTGSYFYWVGEVGVVIDDIVLRRKTGLDGRYRWKVVYKALDMLSAPSEATEWLDLTGERAFLHHIPISNDPRVKQKEVYRSSFSAEDQPFRYAFTIPDNTTTEYFDDIGDDHLGETMEERGVPSGTIKCPKGMIVDEFKDQIVLYQDLENLDLIHYADPYYTYAWSELNARGLPTELVGGKVSFDNLYLFLRNGHIYRINDDLVTGRLTPLGEVFKAVSPWGICKVEEDIAILGDKELNIFTGYEATDIGQAIAPYLDPINYKIEEGVLFYHQDHLYYSVETRAGGSYKLLDCYVPLIKWEDRGLEANCFCAYSGRGDKGELLFGGYDGYIYQLGTAYNSSMKIRSKDYGEVTTDLGKGFLFHEKELQEIRVIAKGKDATSGALTLTLYKNGVTTGITKTIPATGHLDTVYHTYIIPLTGIEDVVIGEQIGFDITHGAEEVEPPITKSPCIKAVLLVGVVTPLDTQYTG